ncbi:MAG: RsmE family RNA methyltransferase [Bacteroidota bacterium]
MDYFHTLPELISASTLVVAGDEFKHLHKVLRKKAGDTIFIMDGMGILYECVIERIDRMQAECSIVRSTRPETEPEVEVTLAVALLRNPSRFDFLVEKTVELGVKRIVPLKTKYTIPSRARRERWTPLAVAAMKQSGRAVLPEIESLTTFDQVLQRGADIKLIAHEKLDTARPLAAVLTTEQTARSLLILIGPEGGFSEEELELAAHHNCVPASLGPRRLRTETAAIVSVALCIFHRRGDAI